LRGIPKDQHLTPNADGEIVSMMETLKVVSRILKYIVNVVGLYFAIIIALLQTTLVYRYPDCEVVRIKISENVGELLLYYIPYVLIISGMNWFVGRKLEQRKDSREFRFLFYANVLVLVVVMIYTSYDFYLGCCG
jgi:hypothetical protein